MFIYRWRLVGKQRRMPSGTTARELDERRVLFSVMLLVRVGGIDLERRDVGFGANAKMLESGDERLVGGPDHRSIAVIVSAVEPDERAKTREKHGEIGLVA